MDPVTTTTSSKVRFEYRYSSRGFHGIIQKLSDEQKEAVKAIGFGGLLDIPCHARIHRQLYAWLLSRMDTERMLLILSDNHQVSVNSESVHRIMGIPNGNISVYGVTGPNTQDYLKTVKRILNCPNATKMPSITDMESNLEKTKQCSTDDEKKLFLCSFLVLVTGMLLSPRQGYEKVPAELYPAFADPLNSKEYAWCDYVIDEMRESSNRVKRSLITGVQSISLHGCYVALQLIYMDSLPIARTLVTDTSEPRLRLYTSSVISKIMKKDTSENKLAPYKDFVNRLCPPSKPSTVSVQVNSQPKTRGQSMLVTHMLSRSMAQQRKRGTRGASSCNVSGPIDVSDIIINDAAQALQMISYVNRDGNLQFDQSNSSQGQTPLEGDEQVNSDTPTTQQHNEPGNKDAYSATTVDAGIGIHRVNDNANNNRANNHMSISTETVIREQILEDDIEHTSPQKRPPCQTYGSIQMPSTLPLPEWSSNYYMLWLPKASFSTDIPRLDFTLNAFDPNNTTFFETSIDADRFAHWVQNNKCIYDFARDWILHRQHRSVLLSGKAIRLELFETFSIGQDICELATRSFRAHEIHTYASSSAIPRHFLSADWSGFIYDGINTTNEDTYWQLFDKDIIGYNITDCRMAPPVACCVTVDRSFFNLLCLPSDFHVVRLEDNSRPLILHNSSGCLTAFEWYSVNGQLCITNGWSEYCKELGLVTGDVCIFKKIGCHNMRLIVQDASGSTKSPLLCQCTVALGHNKVVIPASQIAGLLSRYCYISPWVSLTTQQRELLATVCMVTMPRIPYYVFSYRASMEPTSSIPGNLQVTRICRGYAGRYLPSESGWTKMYYGTKEEFMYVWRCVTKERRTSFTTNWQYFATTNHMKEGSAYFFRFSVDALGNYICIVESLE